MSTKVERFTPPPTEDRIRIEISVEDATILAAIIAKVGGDFLDDLWEGLTGEAGLEYWKPDVTLVDGTTIMVNYDA